MPKQSILNKILFCSLFIHTHHAIAMDSAALKMITLVTKEGAETKLDYESALLMDTVRNSIQDTENPDNPQSQIPPIHLSISKYDLDAQLKALEEWICIKHSDRETGICTPKLFSQVVALSMEQRERKARIGAAARDFSVSSLPSIEMLAQRYRSAHYLSIPENSELTARMIAIMLKSPYNLALLASKPSTLTDNIPAPLAHPDNPINALYRSIPYEMAEPICKYVSPWISQRYTATQHNVSGPVHTQFFPDGKHVAWANGNCASIYDIEENTAPMHAFHQTNRPGTFANIRSLRLSSSGKLAIMAVWEHGISLFNLETKQARTTPIDFTVYDAHISPDETKFIMHGDSNKAPIISVESNQPLGIIAHDRYHNLSAAFFAPHSGFIVTQSNDGVTKITDPHSLRQLHEFKAIYNPNDPINSNAFSADGTSLVYALDKEITVLDARTFARKYLIDHETKVNKAMFSPDGSRIVIIGEPKMVTIFDTRTRKTLNSFRYNGRVEFAGFSPDSRTLLVRFPNDSDDTKMIDIQKGQEVTSLYHSWFKDFAFSADSSLIACNNTLSLLNNVSTNILDGNSGSIIHTIDHNERLNALSLSPDSTQLAIGTRNQLILVQKLPAATLAQHLLIRVLAHAKETGSLNNAWEAPWVKETLATYRKDDGTPDTQSIAKIKEAFKDRDVNNNNDQ